ncbi:MAG: hypothetical protein NT075_22885 [Chloroflexi bacterium]|nr:hypothetical protein [Chloroflexota bacterium]
MATQIWLPKYGPDYYQQVGDRGQWEEALKLYSLSSSSYPATMVLDKVYSQPPRLSPVLFEQATI